MKYMHDIVMVSQKNPETNWKVVREITKNFFLINNVLQISNRKVVRDIVWILCVIFARVLGQEATSKKKLMRFEIFGNFFLLWNVFNQVLQYF